MPTPSKRAVAVAVVLAASTALVGCDRARGCLTGCGSADAGSDAPAYAPKTLATCPMVRACPHVRVVSPVSTQKLGAANTGNTSLGNVVATPLGPAVSWIVTPAQAGQTRRAGVALPEQHKVLAFDIQSTAADPVLAPVVFQRDNEIDLVLPPLYDHVIPISLGTFQAGTSIPIALDTPPGSVPALAGVGQALAALVSPGPTVRFFDATLSDTLVDKPLDSSTNAQVLALAPTCNDLLAYWGSHVAAISPLGDRVAANVDLHVQVNPHFLPQAVWDGAELVISTGDSTVEVNSKGRILSRTPGSMGVVVGTDDGLLSIESKPGQNQVLVRQRSSGTVVHSYDISPSAIVPDVAVVTSRYVYFLQGGMSSVKWVTVECSA